MKEAQEELASLRAENQALNEQVKLLVQTEQRLYSIQNSCDHQLAQIKALADFALSCGAPISDQQADSRRRTGTILSLCLDLLAQTVSIEGAAAVEVDLEHRNARILRTLPETDESDIALEPAEIRWLGALSEVIVTDDPDSWRPPPGELARWCWTQGQEAASTLAILPLRVGGTALHGFLCIYTTVRRRAAHRREYLDERHLPYFQLVTNHLERALESAILTSRLRERTEQLAHSNEKLTESLVRLEEAHQQLVLARKMEAIGRLAGGVAHDFNNLLTVVLGHATLARDSLGSDTALHDDMERIIEAGEKAAGITTQLLALGRQQNQKRERLDLNEQIESMVRVLRAALGDSVLLHLDLEPGAYIHADRAQIEQILLNLLLNARDALPQGGFVRIVTRPVSRADMRRCPEVSEPDRFLCFEVQDDGIGMDEATRTRIFEPFFSTKGSSRGHGLGLAVVYGVVSQSGGYIWVDSQPAKGTCFTLLLPRSSTSPAISEAVAASSPARPVAGTVLLVDDEEAIRRLAATVLRRAGYEVLMAEDGLKALQVARQFPHPIDILVSDVSMPFMGGLEMARLLKQERPQVQILFISGYSPELVESTELNQLGALFLAKPFTPALLLRAVAQRYPVHAG